MANMSYCRFQNTLKDINDCLEAIRNEELLSTEEAAAAKVMLHRIAMFMEDAEITDGCDYNQIDQIIDNLKE